jgi:cytochrome c oxidase subunit III
MSGRRTPKDFRSQAAPREMGRLGMRLLLLSLSMLFAASLVGYVVVRSHASAWPPRGMPAFPKALWVSTLLIMVSSLTVQGALRGVRRGDVGALRRGLALTLVLGLGFLVCQTLNWFLLVAEYVTPKVNLYAFTFYLLTGLHAAHVVGGLIPLGITTRRAFQGAYSPTFHPGVENIATYWHFLDVVWLVLFTVLFLAG